MYRDITSSAIAAGLTAALVGVMSSAALVWSALRHLGADEATAASGFLFGTVGMAIMSTVLSIRSRMPISVVWTMPGMAFLLASPAPLGGLSDAIGAFMVTGALIMVVAIWRPLADLTAKIPPVMASAMLAGVLLSLCLEPARALTSLPSVAVPMLAAFIIVTRIKRLLAFPAALITAVVAIALAEDVSLASEISVLAHPVLTTPSLSLQAALSIALPLFVITMASQNIPGFAILRGFGYRPKARPIYLGTGLVSMLIAPFAGPTLNLAAITAALVANDEADPDVTRRYTAAVIAGIAYVLFGIFAGGLVILMSAAPPEIVRALAGLAVLGAFTGALHAAFSDVAHRESAMITFLISASGISIAGIGSAFWGLMVGAALWVWDERRRGGGVDKPATRQ